MLGPWFHLFSVLLCSTVNKVEMSSGKASAAETFSNVTDM